MRPVDIEADVKEMERRKRVEAIMNSQLFREELERVVGDSIRESGSDSIAGLISDVMNIKTGSKCQSIYSSRLDSPIFYFLFSSFTSLYQAFRSIHFHTTKVVSRPSPSH